MKKIVIFFLAVQFHFGFSQNLEWTVYKAGVTSNYFKADSCVDSTYWWANNKYYLCNKNYLKIDEYQGLPSDYVKSVIIDKNNSLWIGTDAGVTRYNNNWTTFYKENSPIINANCLAADTNNNIWVGTSINIAKFNGNNWQVFDTTNTIIPSSVKNCITIDRSNNVWVGSNKGIFVYDGNNWSILNISNSNLPSNTINAICVDNDNNKWIGTSNGLSYYNGSSWTNYNTTNSNLPSNYIYSIAIDHVGKIWVGTFSGGLAYFDGNIWTIFNTSNSNLPSNNVYSIAIDSFDIKWFGTAKGFVKFDEITWHVYNISNSTLINNFIRKVFIGNNNEIILSHNNNLNLGYTKFDGNNFVNCRSFNTGFPQGDISCIAFDQNDFPWVGTYYNGMSKNNGFSWISYNKYNSPIGINDWVYNIEFDKFNRIWIGTIPFNNNQGGSGLYKLENNLWTKYDTTNSNLCGDNINDISFDNFDNLWVSTECGAAMFDGSDFVIINSENSGLKGKTLLNIVFDDNDNMWVSTFDKGVFEFNGSNWIWWDSIVPNILHCQVMYLAKDYNNVIWAGMDMYGVAKFENSCWSSVINSGNLQYVTIDKNNHLWYSDYSNYVFEYYNDTLHHYNPSNSIIKDHVVKIRSDKFNNIWFCTSNGLIVYHKYSTQNVIKGSMEHEGSLFYPNPMLLNAKIEFLNNENEEYHLKIFNIYGKSVQVYSTRQNSIELNKGNLSKGIYFYDLKSKSGKKQYKRKFLIE